MTDKNTSPLPDSYETRLLAAVRRALRPLVSFLLHRGVTYPMLTNLVRSLYVEQALKEFDQGKKPLPDSRLSLLTGIARRYVKEIRQTQSDEESIDTKASPHVKLIAEWLTAPGYQGGDGKPLALQRKTDKPDSVDFETLARRSDRDAWPGSLLDSLEKMALVQVDKEGLIHLLTQAYLPSNESLESLDFFASHAHDHLSTLRHNLLKQSPPMLERSAFQTHLSEASVKEIRELADNKANQLLRDVYALAASRQQADQSGEATTNHRVRIGVYFYHEDSSNEEVNDD